VAPTRRALLDEIAAMLGGSAHEARFVLDEVLGTRAGRAEWSAPVPSGAAADARRLAARRAAGEPLQYVFGHWSFRELDLLVDPRVLIPRPETEQVVEVALAEARRLGREQSAPGPAALVAVDAGTGTGAIALALASGLGSGLLREVWAIDASSDALDVAAANVAAVRGRHGGQLPTVELALGSWLAPLPARLRGEVGLVVSNPPYVSEDEWAGLAPEVRAEPRRALVAGPGSDGTPGLADVEAVLAESRAWLARPGTVVVELAPQQAGAAADLARRLGYDEVRVEPDLAGRARALVARAVVTRAVRRRG
jgi:release factor glutamine methyltransferase